MTKQRTAELQAYAASAVAAAKATPPNAESDERTMLADLASLLTYMGGPFECDPARVAVAAITPEITDAIEALPDTVTVAGLRADVQALRRWLVAFDACLAQVESA